MIRKSVLLTAIMTITSMLVFSPITNASTIHNSTNSKIQTAALAQKQYLKAIAMYDKNLFAQVLAISSNGQKCLDKKITYKAFQADFKREYSSMKAELVKVQKSKCASTAKAFKNKYDGLLKQYVTWIGTLNRDIKANRTSVPGSQKREESQAQYFASAFKKLTM